MLAVGGLQLGVLNLEAQEFLTILVSLFFLLVSDFYEEFHVLLELDLNVELGPGEILLGLELLEHHGGLFVLELQAELKSGNLFAFSLKLELLLVSLSDTTTLCFMLKLHILLIDFALFCQDVVDLHLHSISFTLEFQNA